MANCHDQGSFDSQALQQCVGGCSVALQEVNQMIGNELSYFQGASRPPWPRLTPQHSTWY